MLGITRRILLAASPSLLASCLGRAVSAIEPPLHAEASDLEGNAHGFPALRSLEGVKLADGDFTQWLEGNRLHIRILYDFGPTRSIEETAEVEQEPELVQHAWSWCERRSGQLYRKFTVDFASGVATAEKQEGGRTLRWTEHVDVEPGRTFAGSVFTLALKCLRRRLISGETISIRTVGFTPKPRAASVEVSYAGLDQVPMSGRTLAGERFVIHARIPWIARLFVHVPDTHLWLTSPAPAAFLRWEGPLAEPSDDVVRVDLLPGDPSGRASPSRSP